jgi:hypothetical protein
MMGLLLQINSCTGILYCLNDFIWCMRYFLITHQKILDLLFCCMMTEFSLLNHLLLISRPWDLILKSGTLWSKVRCSSIFFSFLFVSDFKAQHIYKEFYLKLSKTSKKPSIC